MTYKWYKCRYAGRCPSKSGWCINGDPSRDCIPYIEGAIKSRTHEIKTANEIIRAINNTKEGQAVFSKEEGEINNRMEGEPMLLEIKCTQCARFDLTRGKCLEHGGNPDEAIKACKKNGFGAFRPRESDCVITTTQAQGETESPFADVIIDMSPEVGLNRLADEIHTIAKEHGWYDTKREIPECIALMHSELSEALEAYRNGEALFYHGCARSTGGTGICENNHRFCGVVKAKTCEAYSDKPEGVGVELVDCIIRILDTCAYLGVDVEKVIRDKIEYNRTRPYRHGGKVC